MKYNLSVLIDFLRIKEKNYDIEVYKELKK